MGTNSTLDCSSVWAPGYLSILSSIVSTMFCVIITLGNLMVIIVVVKDPLTKLRSLFNYFVVNLAFADLIVGIMSMPIGIYAHVLEYMKEQPPVLRIAFTMSLFVSLTASILCLIALSIDRYVAITYPMKYRANLSKRKCVTGSLVIWVVSFSLAVVYLEVGYIDYLMIYVNTSVAIAGIVLVATYIRINRFLSNQSKKLKRSSKKFTKPEISNSAQKKTQQLNRVTGVFLWILFLFLVCFVPATIVVYILQFCVTCSCRVIHIMRDTSFYLITVNSCINPFVCILKNKNYKRALSFLCHRKRRRSSSENAPHNLRRVRVTSHS